MKETIRENITHLPYSLHDMRVTAMKIEEDCLRLHFAQGYEQIAEVCTRVKGDIVFHQVDWDFSYIYLYETGGTIGPFCGEKLYLRDFIGKKKKISLEIVDETYGYNKSKFAGYITMGKDHQECNLEIYHLGDMVYETRST